MPRPKSPFPLRPSTTPIDNSKRDIRIRSRLAARAVPSKSGAAKADDDQHPLVTAAPVFIRPVLISRERSAEAIDVSIRTIDAMIARGQLITRKLGARTLVLYSSLEKLGDD